MTDFSKADFVKFIHQSHDTPSLSMSKGGRFNINAAAIEHFKLAAFKYGIIHFSKKHNSIGLEFTNEPQDSAIVLRKANTKNPLPRQFSAPGFPFRFKVEPFRPKTIRPIPDQSFFYVTLEPPT